MVQSTLGLNKKVVAASVVGLIMVSVISAFAHFVLPISYPFVTFSHVNLTTDKASKLVPLQGSTFNICIQDEHNGDSLKFNSNTGDYQFTRCGIGGFSRFGRGLLSSGRACVLTLRDSKLTATIDTCTFDFVKSGKATYRETPFGSAFTISDSNISNNTCNCDNTDVQGNFIAGQPNFLQDNNGNISIQLPVLIALANGRSSISTSFEALLETTQGTKTKISEGVIGLLADEPSNCTGSGTMCTGKCSDVTVTIEESSGTSCTNVDFGPLKVNSCNPTSKITKTYKTAAVCGVGCVLIFCGSTCACREITVLKIDLNRSQIPVGSFIVYRLDPLNQTIEFDETDNVVRVPIPSLQTNQQ